MWYHIDRPKSGSGFWVQVVDRKLSRTEQALQRRRRHRYTQLSSCHPGILPPSMQLNPGMPSCLAACPVAFRSRLPSGIQLSYKQTNPFCHQPKQVTIPTLAVFSFLSRVILKHHSSQIQLSQIRLSQIPLSQTHLIPSQKPKSK